MVVRDAVRGGDVGDGPTPARRHAEVHEDAECEVGVQGVLHGSVADVVWRHGVMVSLLEKW
jgi:hypothetical protein